MSKMPQIVKTDLIKLITQINTTVQEKYDKIIHSKEHPDEYKNDIEKRAVKFGQAIEVLIEEIENSQEL